MHYDNYELLHNYYGGMMLGKYDIIKKSHAFCGECYVSVNGIEINTIIQIDYHIIVYEDKVKKAFVWLGFGGPCYGI